MSFSTVVRVHVVLRHFAMIIGLVVASSEPTTAQEAWPLPPTPHPFGQLKMGVLSFTPAVKLAEIGIDSNVFDLSTGTERRAPDFTTTIEPNLETRIRARSFDARVTGRMGLVYYRTYASERAINPAIDLAVTERISPRFSLYGKGNVGFTKDRPGLEVDARARRFEVNGTAGGRLTGRRLEVDLHGAYSEIAYDDTERFLNTALAQTLNRTSRGGGASLSYKVTPLTSLAVGVDGSFDTYPHSPDRDATTAGGYVAIRFKPRAVISGDAEVGYRQVDARSAAMPTFAGITRRVGLSYKLRDVFTAAAGAQRDLQNSFYGERPYFVYTLYEGSLSQAILHRFDVGAGIQYTSLDYRWFVVPDGPRNQHPPEILRMVSASVGAPVTRQLRIAWYIQRWERLSSDRPYQTIRSGLTFSLGRANLSPRGVFLHGPGR